MQTAKNPSSETERLQQTTRDLVAISTLQAFWGSLSPEEVIKNLSQVFLDILNLDSVYIRLASHERRESIEAISSNQRDVADLVSPSTRAELDRFLAQRDVNQDMALPDLFGDGQLCVHPTRFGIAEDNGVVIAASHRADFPSEHDRLLLSFGANQAAAVIQRWRTEQALMMSEKRFLEIADAGPAMLWVTEPDGFCSFLSRSWHEFTGQRKDEGFGYGWTLAIHPEDRETAKAAFIDANVRKKEYEDEFRLLHADGSYRWVIDAGRPRFSISGEFLGFVGNVLDITHRKQAEEALHNAQALMSTVFEILPVGVGVFSPDGSTILSNQQMQHYLPTNILPSQDGERHARWNAHDTDGRLLSREEFPGARALRGERVVPGIEALYTQDDGTKMWTQVAAVPIRNDRKQITGQVAVVTNIDASKRIEEALRLSEEKYRTLFSKMDEGFGIVEVILNNEGEPADFRYLETNPVFEQQTGLNEVIGKTIRQMVPNVEALWIDAFGRIALTGQAERFADHSSALGRWFDVNAFPIGKPEDRHVAFVFRDITESKLIEQELREADRRKDEFLAMLAHELRNPLAPISAGSELLQMVRLDGSQVRQTSEIIGRQVRHMNNLIDDLLDVSRVKRGLVELDNTTLDMRHVIAEAVEQTGPIIQLKRHQLALHLPPDEMMVLGDGKRLVQIVTNILNNAAKYTPEGGNIALHAEVLNDDVLLNVKDNGVGMSPELLSRVFDLFTQAERSSDRSTGGLGLGLALVKSLVELHGGSVKANSDGADKGSLFTIRLPRLRRPVEQPDTTQSDGALQISSSSLKILVVDDNADAATLLSMLLEASGHQVLVENGARSALERASIERPDVCVLDIGLPDMNGNELAQHLRAMPEAAETLLIALTGYGQEEDKKATLAAGFDYHLVKPVDFKTLFSILVDASSR
ncbi:PAS domain S-box protein [Noviherbaspirillum sp. L7-7A]|uniref:hybrid sensor histidine kinase/response regulator n=1 Tax=Noviherbaspirillum sp. L7-7A TaxID=2850560 RepID=UPI001C2BA011|nr:PAS domain S-box protein [Noviherbaspirillum sp. L7-7A]MBV0881529.1 PAS domain S-box protein [Noviherbaspirillum sp. L7-7A]